MSSIPEAIIMGMHRQGKMPNPYEAGFCIFCDKPVFLSSRTGIGEIGVEDYKNITKKRLMGAECFIPTVMQFIGLMGMPDEVRAVILEEFKQAQQRIN